MPQSFLYSRLIVAGLAMATVQIGVAQDEGRPVDELVEEIIDLRASVDELDSTLSRLKDEHRSRMNALAREEGQLDAERERQTMKVRRLEQRLTEQRQDIVEAGIAGERLRPVLENAIDDLREHVESSIPFKRDERLSELEDLDRQLAGEGIPPARIANRLWSFIADENRLIGESGLYRQRISIDGNEKLVDVARLGMLQLYFRTDDGEVGYAVTSDDGWAFRYADSDERRQINDYVDALQKQVRSGFFELPSIERSVEFRR